MNAQALSSEPVSSAYAQFLEQLNDDAFWQIAADAAHAAHDVSMAQVPADDYLECVLSRGRCLLPLAAMREIVSPPYYFSRFPASPPWMVGIGTWRGETIAVVDLDAYLFQHPARSPHGVKDGILAVAQLDDLLLGFLVTDVGSVTTLDVEQVVSLEQVPTWYTHLQREAVIGVKCDGGGSRQPSSEALLLDMFVLVNDIVLHLKNDPLL
jgi:chemotaxis signal transduction protein